MATQVTNYQCPACHGPLQFSASSGKLECEYCESKFTVEEVEALYKTRDEKAAREFEAEAPLAEGETPWDYSGLSGSWGDDGANMRAYTCPSCGARLLCDNTTAATACPYCGSNAIVPGQFTGTLKPDLILPFRLDKTAAIAALKAHYKGKWLLPTVFRQENHLQQIQGVYVPFWLFDAQVDVDARFRGINTLVTRTGDYEITHRDFFLARRQGSVEFVRVPVDGSEKMNDEYMDSLEPFDYTQLKPFSTGYLPGYLADRYDQSAEACARRADVRCENSAVAAMRASVLGYQNVLETEHRVSIRRGRVRYALLPVWVLHTKWQEKDYLFMMNGQTGKFVGDLPVDRKKSALATLGLTALMTLLLTLTQIGPGLAALLMDLMAGG